VARELACNGNIKTLVRRGRGYKNLGYLLLKAQRMAVTETEFIVLHKTIIAMAPITRSHRLTEGNKSQQAQGPEAVPRPGISKGIRQASVRSAAAREIAGSRTGILPRL
jgi:hypothetical protein